MFCFLSPNRPIWDHVSYTGCWPIYRQPSGLTVSRRIGRYFGRASVESWISLGRVVAGSWTSLDRYPTNIATDMLTDRQLRCRPIHENSPEFGPDQSGISRSWYVWRAIVSTTCIDRYLVTKGKALGMRFEKHIVQVMSIENQYTTDILLILHGQFTDTLPTHYQFYHNWLSVDLSTNTRPTVKHRSADMSAKLQLFKVWIALSTG